MRELKQYIHQGRITNIHGVKGEVKMEVWCDNVSDFMKIKTLYLDCNGEKALKISSYRPAAKFVIATIEGVGTPEEAVKYKGKDFYVNRNDLNIPQGRCLTADIIGLDVIDADNGKKYGVVEDIIFNPANEIYVVATPHGQVLVPAVKQFTVKIDVLDAVYIRPIEGMFDEN